VTNKSLSLPVKELFLTISSALVNTSDFTMVVVLEELISNGDVEAASRAVCEVSMSSGLKALCRVLLCFLSIRPPTKSSVTQYEVS
jgi:hypothetical protein